MQRASGPRRDRPPPQKGAAPTLWLYGRHAVKAALANPERRIRRLVVARELEAEAAALLKDARADVPETIEIKDRAALGALLPADAVHQGIAAAADPLPRRALDDVLAAAGDGPLIAVVLDQVSDPHNVGAVLRSAAAFAACAVIVPEHGSPPATGVLAKAASGALETVPLIRVGNLARALARLKEVGFWCIGLEAAAAETLAALDLPPRVALVLGAEGAGLRRLTREACDFLARLPTRGEPASLNVSNAAAVALYIASRGLTGPSRESKA